jgi:hypothetical protein
MAMIEYLAQFYVNVLEPGLQILAVALLVVFLLYIFNLLRGGAAKGDALSTIVNGVVKLLLQVIRLLGVAVARFLKSTIRTLRLLFATVRDFLFSKDL